MLKSGPFSVFARCMDVIGVRLRRRRSFGGQKAKLLLGAIPLFFNLGSLAPTAVRFCQIRT